MPQTARPASVATAALRPGCGAADGRTDQEEQCFDAERGDEKDRRCLGEVGEERTRGCEHAPEWLRLRADVAVPRGHHERDHRCFHERRPVPHHVDVVGRDERARNESGLAAGEPAHAAREEHDRRQPGQFRDKAGLPQADAEERERHVLEAGEDRRDVHRVPAVLHPCAEHRHVAGVVHPRALVVPDDADSRPPGRIGVREDAAQQSGQDQDEGERDAEAARCEVGHLHRQSLEL